MAFEELGFRVAPGGVHDGGATHNALIALADGSYMELLAFTGRLVSRALPMLESVGLGRLLTGSGGRDPMAERFRARAPRRSGLIDFALLPTSMDADLTRARREGVRIRGPIEGGRLRPGYAPIAWELGLPEAPELPFFCSDLTDRSERVPSGEVTQHANGVTGIRAVTVAVEKLEPSSARYRAMLGVEPEPAALGGTGVARGRIFRIEGVDVTVATTEDPTHAMWRHLRERGEGPFELTLTVEAPSRTGVAEVCGARLNLILDRPRSLA